MADWPRLLPGLTGEMLQLQFARLQLFSIVPIGPVLCTACL